MWKKLLVCLLLSWSIAAPGAVRAKTFSENSLIIPMGDVSQGVGKFKAIGLVFELLRNGIPLEWAIQNGKLHDTTDFLAWFVELYDFVPIYFPFGGGPFVVSAEHADEALPIAMNWVSVYTDVTVHIATQPFDSDVGRVLHHAPSIALFADGNEDIAMGYLNAAAIPDANGNAWSKDSPDILSVSDVEGPTAGLPHQDGALFDSDGTPEYCQLVSMHWDEAEGNKNPGVVKEVRSFLNHPTQFFAECQAVNAFENADGGQFLTTGGLVKGTKPTVVSHEHPDSPYSQTTGIFGTVGGSEPSFGLAEGSSYHNTTGVILKGLVSAPGENDVWFRGYLEGACSRDGTLRTLAGEISRGHRLPGWPQIQCRPRRYDQRRDPAVFEQPSERPLRPGQLLP